MIRTTLTILSLLTLTYAGGFQGTVTSNLGDQVAGAHIIGKRGNTVVVDTFANDAGEYLLNWSTVGVAGGIDFNLPSTQLTGLGNSITSNGRVYPFLNGSPSNVAYRVYDLSGREVTYNPVYAQGKYFLQVFNKTSGKILGVESFIYLDGNGLEVQFKADLHTTNNLAKAMEDTDSLIVEYTGSGMLLERYAEAVVVPESYETRDIVLTRTLRGPVFELTDLPENPTIDRDYMVGFDAYHPDYDAYVSSVGLVHELGGVDYYFNGLDSLVITPHEAGSYSFNITVGDSRGDSLSLDYTLAVESIAHLVQTLDFFYALDEPYPGLEVYLRDKMAITDVNGVAALEFPTTSPALTIQDSIEIYHPTNDTTFFAIRMPVDTEVDTQVVQTFTDPHGPSYWEGWVWDNIWHRISFLDGIINNPAFFIKRFGHIETGLADTIFVYCPDYTSPAGVEYKPIIQEVFNERNLDIDERAGISQQSKVVFQIMDNTIEDSLYALEYGMMFHFDPDESNHAEISTRVHNDRAYIQSADLFLSYGISNTELGIARLIGLIDHEALNHGLGTLGHTPYNSDHPDNMENSSTGGASYVITEHEKDAIFLKLNFAYFNIRHLIGYETFHLGD